MLMHGFSYRSKDSKPFSAELHEALKSPSGPLATPALLEDRGSHNINSTYHSCILNRHYLVLAAMLSFLKCLHNKQQYFSICRGHIVGVLNQYIVSLHGLDY